MVSSTIVAKLKAAFNQLRTLGVDIHNYADEEAEVVFDIVTTDTFIAGIADKLIEGDRVSMCEAAILKKCKLNGDVWMTEEGRQISLAGLPEVLAYSKAIDKVRRLCLKLA